MNNNNYTSSAANFKTAVKGVFSGTLKLKYKNVIVKINYHKL